MEKKKYNVTRNQIERIEKYQRANMQRVVIKLNINTDIDIMEHLDKQPNKQGYIKSLIQADLNKSKEES